MGWGASFQINPAAAGGPYQADSRVLRQRHLADFADWHHVQIAEDGDGDSSTSICVQLRGSCCLQFVPKGLDSKLQASDSEELQCSYNAVTMQLQCSYNAVL